jgi:hypothetical protein
MPPGELANFDLDPQKNDFLFFERGRPRTTILVLVGLLGLLLWMSALITDPNWHPHYLRGKGAWVIALMLLMPIAVRAVVLAVTTGWIAEAGYRFAVRCFDGKPDFAIGASGVADLNPWAPRAILWRDLTDVRRVSTPPSLFTRGRSVCLQFVANRQRPSWFPPGLWDAMPACVTEVRIAITPRSVGMDDEDVRRLIERYSGRIAISERTI